MKRWCTFLMAVFASGCVTANHVFTISQARLAGDLKDRKICVAGYFYEHFEGSSLEPKPGAASVDGLPLRWISRPALIPLQHVRAFHGKYVITVGILKVGPIYGARLGELPYLDVLEIKEANQAPEPTPPAVTIRADARLAPAGGVAHL